MTGKPMNKQDERQKALPFSRAARIAWKNIRIRLVRSLLVTSGIILAVAFLSYIMMSNSFVTHVTERGSQELLESLERDGVLAQASDADRRIETRWMLGLALMISFVGILNAMLMSVTERFREIGTMKCLGALNSFIVRLFLIESTFQGIAGTVIGLLVGVVLAFGEGLTRYGGEVWCLIPAGRLAAVLGVCFLSGTILAIAGAIYPALQAAKMAPVEAMRSEV